MFISAISHKFTWKHSHTIYMYMYLAAIFMFLG